MAPSGLRLHHPAIKGFTFVCHKKRRFTAGRKLSHSTLERPSDRIYLCSDEEEFRAKHARRLGEEEIITCGSCQDDSSWHHFCFRFSFLLTFEPFVKFFIKLFYIVGRKKRLEINIHGMNTISAFHRAPVAGIFAPTLCRAYFRWHAALRYTRSFDSREIARAGFQGGGRSGSVWL